MSIEKINNEKFNYWGLCSQCCLPARVPVKSLVASSNQMMLGFVLRTETVRKRISNQPACFLAYFLARFLSCWLSRLFSCLLSCLLYCLFSCLFLVCFIACFLTCFFLLAFMPAFLFAFLLVFWFTFFLDCYAVKSSQSEFLCVFYLEKEAQIHYDKLVPHRMYPAPILPDSRNKELWIHIGGKLYPRNEAKVFVFSIGVVSVCMSLQCRWPHLHDLWISSDSVKNLRGATLDRVAV